MAMRIGPKLHREWKKKGIKTAFESSVNLKKSTLLPSCYPGVYELKCSYLGETRHYL